MRLFLAIPIPDAALHAALSVQSALKERITRQGVRFTAPHKMHLTLAFLGNDFEPEEADRIASAAAECAGAIHLSLGTLGAFPDMNRPKTIWLGVDGVGLSDLAGRLQAAFGLQTGQFVGHATLARVSPASKAVGWLLKTQDQPEHPQVSWIAQEVQLIASLPSGEYETLKTYRL